MRILGICGSLQAKSANLSLLEAARTMAPVGVDFSLFDGIRDLPHFDPDLEASGTPAAVCEWRRALTGSDALLIASPEYGHSLPGSLKNAIDWVIGSGELEQKIVAVTASTPASDRGILGLSALSVTLGAVSARIVGGLPIARGPGFEQDLGDLLKALIEKVESSA